MRKKLMALAVTLCLTVSLATTGASAVDDNTALETIRALGILTGDSTGNLNLTKAVTRGEFVTMMTAASSDKGTVGTGGGVSLFKDVKSDHWASEYIRLAVEQDWMSGYVDGTFRPENQITLEEACTALLKLLGYTSSDLAGSYPAAQLSKAASVGLRDDLQAVQGQVLTRQSCVTLFYNLLVSDTNTGPVYGTSLGYTISNGQVDYATLVSTHTRGPYVATNAAVSAPFTPTAVYRNGALSSLSAVQTYDVYYYNTNLTTVWIYSDRISGTLTGVSPSTTAPSSVTVAGSSYTLGTSAAVYQCSSQGAFTQGDLVTLLLGMNGEVVDVIAASEAQSVNYGVVLSSQKVSSTAATSTAAASIQIKTEVACTDGTVRTFYTSQTSTVSTGRLVMVTVDGSGTAIRGLQKRSLEGAVNSSGTAFASYDFAAGVEILDTDSEGGYVRIYPSRLAGLTLKEGDVAYYSLNSSGDIERMILDEATGDTLDYIYVSSVAKSSEDDGTSASYTYYRDGQQVSLNSSATYSVKLGGAIAYYEDGALKSMRQLSSGTITQLSDRYALVGNQKYTLADNIQVLLRTTGSSGYYVTTLSELDTEQYTLTGWYDDLGYSAGGQIRIIVVVDKES